jgi:hypothetical protein
MCIYIIFQNGKDNNTVFLLMSHGVGAITTMTVVVAVPVH